MGVQRAVFGPVHHDDGETAAPGAFDLVADRAPDAPREVRDLRSHRLDALVDLEHLQVRSRLALQRIAQLQLLSDVGAQLLLGALDAPAHLGSIDHRARDARAVGLDHVPVGDDVAVPIDDEARAHAPAGLDEHRGVARALDRIARRKGPGELRFETAELARGGGHRRGRGGFRPAGRELRRRPCRACRRCAGGCPPAHQPPDEDDADDRGEGDRTPARSGRGRHVLHTFARTARESRLLLREFGEIDAARCAFDRVSLLMPALRTVHRPPLIPPQATASLGPDRIFRPPRAAGPVASGGRGLASISIYNRGIASTTLLNR